MNIFLILFLAILAIAVLLRFRVMIGLAILAAGAVMWILNDRSLATLWSSAVETATLPRTYDLIFALYFVMCLEVQLRKSGTLKGMVEALNRLFSSSRITLAVMPAFLGLLPSLGGARFSAPIVQAASEGMNISPARKASINYYFRHIFETSSPTVPGMLLACAIAGIHLSDLVLHLIWFAAATFIVGWFVLLAPLKGEDHVKKEVSTGASRLADFGNVALAISPVVLNILLMLIFNMPAGIAMGISVLALIPTFYFRHVPGLHRDGDAHLRGDCPGKPHLRRHGDGFRLHRPDAHSRASLLHDFGGLLQGRLLPVLQADLHLRSDPCRHLLRLDLLHMGLSTNA